jgi:hypothetical protein
MVGLTVTATLVSLMMHAAVGCCLHHAHPTSAVTAAGGPLCHDCHGEARGTAVGHVALGADTHDGDSHEEPGHGDECECVFASSGKRLALESPLAAVLQATCTGTVRLVVAPVNRWESATSHCRFFSAAIYVVQQRLLI